MLSFEGSGGRVDCIRAANVAALTVDGGWSLQPAL